MDRKVLVSAYDARQALNRARYILAGRGLSQYGQRRENLMWMLRVIELDLEAILTAEQGVSAERR